MALTRMKSDQLAINNKIEHWTDLWLARDRKTGYIAVTDDFKTNTFIGLKDKKRLLDMTKGREHCYMSLNAFDVNWNDTAHSRTSKRLKQIRNIGVDIDQYELGLSIPEAMTTINDLIRDEIIPEPNLIIKSHGIQLFYTIQGGASPEMSWLTSYITEQFILKMKDIGADGVAKDVARLMRVPESVNERNGRTVHPEIRHSFAYTLQELQAYTKPLNQFKTRQNRKISTIHSDEIGLVLYHRTNNARIKDFKELIQLRGGNFTNIRNIFLYIFSYHQASTADNLNDLIWLMENNFKDVYSADKKEGGSLKEYEFKATVKSAYNDAEEFFNHHKANGYQMTYKENDGIKKPYTTDNVIELLKITAVEQEQLRTLTTPEIKLRNKRNAMRMKRRAKGMRPMTEYQQERQKQRLERVKQLADLLVSKPNKTQGEYAKMLEVSRTTVSKDMKDAKALIQQSL